VSPASISWHLSQAGHITPQPRKRPKSSYIRHRLFAEKPKAFRQRLEALWEQGR
jgi:hypothetical protein